MESFFTHMQKNVLDTSNLFQVYRPKMKLLRLRDKKIFFHRLKQIAWFVIIWTVINLLIVQWNKKMTWSEKNSIEGDLEKKDWHDWNFIEYEKTRKGPGEHGEPFFLTDARDIELNQKLLEEFGLCTVVNDKVSVNRSIPDTRPSK